MDEATYVEGFHNKTQVQMMTYNSLGNTGLRVSKFGLGGGPFGGLYEAIEEKEAATIIKEALQSGINYIDTAPFYGEGRSEKFIGKALKDIPRKSYYIGTKIGRYTWSVHDQFDFSAEKTRWSVDNSLKLLGLDYVDIIQIHDFEYAENLDQIVNETLPALQQIVNEGKARFIGITSYVLSVIKEVLKRSTVKIDSILTYSRFTLVDDGLLDYIPYFQEKEVGLINAGVVALGLLTESGPSEWHPATQEIKDACKKAANYCKDNNVDFGRLAVMYSFTEKRIATHLIGVGKLKFLRSNLQMVSESLSKVELAHIQEIKKRYFSNLKSKNWEGNDPLFAQLEEFRKQH